MPKPLLPVVGDPAGPQRLLASHLHAPVLIERAFSDPVTVSGAALPCAHGTVGGQVEAVGTVVAAPAADVFAALTADRRVISVRYND